MSTWSIIEERPEAADADIGDSWLGRLIERQVDRFYRDGARGDRLSTSLLDWLVQEPSLPFERVDVDEDARTIRIRRIGTIATTVVFDASAHIVRQSGCAPTHNWIAQKA